MTTRRQVLALASASLLAGCTGRADAAGVPDLLLVDTAAGLALVRGIATKLLGTALATPAGTRLYTTGAAGDDTVLASVAAATGTPFGRTVLAGRWVPGVVTPDGHRLALMQPREAGDSGARQTTILVADDGREHSRIELPGDLEPDAFARDGHALFMLERLRAPERYRVRLVDLTTRGFVETLTRDKRPVPVGTEEQMYATARLSVLAPDR